MSIPIITYTNNKCSDAWPVYIDLIKKYYGKVRHTMLTDDKTTTLIPGLDYYVYGNKDPFYDVWLRCLSNFPSEYFLYMQEDFFLYKPVDKDKLEYYLRLMENNTDISCIRLLKSGITSNIPLEGVPTLFYVDYNTDYAFSMQPSIWRVKDFLKLQETKIQIIPWDEDKMTGHVLADKNILSLYHYDNEPKRGMAHYDSNIFPYIATALVKGKWNTKEYPELVGILQEYGIDVNKRGEYQ